MGFRRSAGLCNECKSAVNSISFIVLVS